MRMKKITVLSIFVVLVVFLSACGGSDAPEELLDTTWEWTELVVVDPESRSAIADPPNYTIFFSSDGFVDVEADCNYVQGKYDISGDSVEFKVDAPLLAECGIESSYCPYLFRLVQAETYRIEGGKLVLTYGEGAGELIFNSVGSNVDAAGEGAGEGDSGSAGEGADDAGSKKVTVCHKPDSKNPVTIEISRNALQAHLNHGDREGACK
jgi:hypothetical protein